MKIATIPRFNIDRRYVSEIDKFLTHFDQQHSKKSKSQQQEIDQYQDLFCKRDFKTSKHGS